jgi:hypothetical protein
MPLLTLSAFWADSIYAKCILSILMLFAIHTEASVLSVLRMLDGSSEVGLHDHIIKYVEDLYSNSLSTPVRYEVYDHDPKTCLLTRVQDIKVPVTCFDRVNNLQMVPVATFQVRFHG